MSSAATVVEQQWEWELQLLFCVSLRSVRTPNELITDSYLTLTLSEDLTLQLLATATPTLAIYSQTVVRLFSYVRQSYDIETTPFAIHERWRTYDWRKYERKSATYLPMSYDRS